jgi:hypothetical protein
MANLKRCARSAGVLEISACYSHELRYKALKSQAAQTRLDRITLEVVILFVAGQYLFGGDQAAPAHAHEAPLAFPKAVFRQPLLKHFAIVCGPLATPLVPRYCDTRMQCQSVWTSVPFPAPSG